MSDTRDYEKEANELGWFASPLTGGSIWIYGQTEHWFKGTAKQLVAKYGASTKPLTEYKVGDKVKVKVPYDGFFRRGVVDRINPHPRRKGDAQVLVRMESDGFVHFVNEIIEIKPRDD